LRFVHAKKRVLGLWNFFQTSFRKKVIQHCVVMHVCVSPPELKRSVLTQQGHLSDLRFARLSVALSRAGLQIETGLPCGSQTVTKDWFRIQLEGDNPPLAVLRG
jgi:hypothetical protein